jgi:hypothetical protein
VYWKAIAALAADTVVAAVGIKPNAESPLTPVSGQSRHRVK